MLGSELDRSSVERGSELSEMLVRSDKLEFDSVDSAKELERANFASAAAPERWLPEFEADSHVFKWSRS